MVKRTFWIHDLVVFQYNAKNNIVSVNQGVKAHMNRSGSSLTRIKRIISPRSYKNGMATLTLNGLPRFARKRPLSESSKNDNRNDLNSQNGIILKPEI